MSPKHYSGPLQEDLFRVRITPPERPANVAELSDRYHLLLKPTNFQAIPEQFDFIGRFLTEPGNFLLQARTGSGKSFVALAVASHYMHDYKRVIFVTPQDILIPQVTRQAVEALTLNENKIARVSGAVAPTERAKIYKDRSKCLLITTPEALFNDVSSGIIDLKDFSLVVLDEVHQARGQDLYALVARKIREAGVRSLSASASPAADVQGLSKLVETVGIEQVHRMSLKEMPKKHLSVDVTLDPEMLKLADLLRLAARKVFTEMKTVLGKDHELVSLMTEISVKDNTFRIPTSKGIEQLKAATNALIENRAPNEPRYTGKLFADVLGDNKLGHSYALKVMACVVGEIGFLQQMLLTEGRIGVLGYAFRRYLEQAESNVVPSGKEIPKFTRATYGVDEVRQLVDAVADKTPLSGIIQNPEQFLRDNKDSLGKKGGRVKLQEATLRAAFKELAASHYFNHSKTEMMIELITEHLANKQEGKILVFNGLTDTAFFHGERINFDLKKSDVEAISVVGKSYMGLKERQANLDRFASDPLVRICSSTKVLEEGLDIKDVSMAIMMVPTSEPDRVIQRAGRVRAELGIIYHLIGEGTSDKAVYAAGLRRVKTMNQAVAGAMADLEFKNRQG